MKPSHALVAVLSFVTMPATVGKTQDQKPLDFQPGLKLKWPGKPTESSQVFPPENGGTKHYSADYIQMRPSGVIVYSAFVTEYPEKAAKRLTPKRMLEAYTFAFKKNETSRKVIEHGKKKLPGLEIRSRSEKHFDWRIVVLSGSRIYHVSVSSRDESALDSAEAKAFLASLAVGD